MEKIEKFEKNENPEKRYFLHIFQVTTPAPVEFTTGFDDGGRFPPNKKPLKPATTPKPQTSTWKPTTTRKTTTKAPSSGENKPQSGGSCSQNGETKSHPDCQKYFRCVNKKYVLQTCTVGLAWDNSSGRCNWANLVSCGSRISNFQRDSTENIEQTTEKLAQNTQEKKCNPGKSTKK